MANAMYFAPTYFAPAYFGPLQPTLLPKPPVPTSAAFGDADAFTTILAALESTGAFESVLFGVQLERQALAAATPLVSLVPEGWEEFDDVDPTSILRRVSFRLDLLVRGDDPLARHTSLARLDSAVHTALEGSGLGGCLPALTRLRRAGYDPRSLHPEQAARIDGEFTYIIGPSTIPGVNP